MVGEDSFVPKVWEDRDLACSHEDSHPEIRTKRTNRYHPEAEVGLRERGPVGDKAGDQVGDQVRNLNKHRMPMLQSHQLLKTNQKSRRTNNAEALKQYNRPTALPI